MSTPRREEVDHRVEYGGGLIRVADAADRFRKELEEAYPALEDWDGGYATAAEEMVLELSNRFRASGELQLRCAESDRASRAAHAHLSALDAVDALNELREMKKANAAIGAETFGPIGAPFRYVTEVGERGELPTARSDAQRAFRKKPEDEELVRRVYAVVAEEPVCVAVEADGEWEFTREVP